MIDRNNMLGSCPPFGPARNALPFSLGGPEVVARPAIHSRVRSVMCNATVLRGSPESKASNLMRLLEEQGLKVVESV